MGHITSFLPRVLRGYPTAVEALDEPETVLLGGLRGWVAALRRSEDPRPVLGGLLAEAGAPAAAAPLDMVLRIVARTARHPVGIACPHCPRIAPDEQRLLHAVRLVQGGEGGLAEETLRDGLLSPTGAGFAMVPLRGLGRGLVEAGLVLCPRSLTGLAQDAAGGTAAWMPLAPDTRP